MSGLKTRATAMLVDSEKAKEFLAMPFPRQRPMGKKVTARYADEMRRGLWRPGRDISFGVLRTGGETRKYLVNGQHRLRAVIESDTAQEFAVVEVDCDSADELNAQYYTIDRGKGRQPGDVYLASGIMEDLQVTRTQMSAIGASVKFILAGFKPKGDAAMSDDDLLDAIFEYEDGIIGYLASVSGADQFFAHRVRRTAIMSVGIVTFQYAASIYGEPKVEEFWEGFALDDGLRQDDPRKVLREHVINSQMPSASAKSTSRTFGPAYQARYAAHCFNAWVQGKKFATAKQRPASKVLDPLAPIKILGTPWNGSK